ncbi:hypothetical protein [uncultured Methylovirgula sp.]|uniref:hypothetical protein n=1 Tax=uncultured Methylovirgula sp. TaxID=1285960 RepID=UPI002636F929|nr:hypothetical protein [uncultured Methylovirgula sp.]
MTAKSAETPRPAAVGRAPLPVWLLILLALALGLAMSWTGARGVWLHNTFSDPDDAMQLVQVRNLLAGQNWFDLTIGRLDPPHGVFMHWSRVIDVPLALSIKTIGLFMPADMAERLTRLLFPLMLQGLLYAGIARLARRLAGPHAILPAIVLTLLSGLMYAQFQPGRINHSATQIVLVVFMLGSFVEALEPARGSRAALAGLLAALSLSISLENLPWILVLGALAIGFWIAGGAALRSALIAFGLGLGAALPVAFVATIGQAHWLDASCDAYSLAYLVPGLAGAAAIVLLGFLSPRLANRPARLAAALVATGGVAASVALSKPVCFLDPYHGIDPLLRELWLRHVEEALPLSRFFAMRPVTALSFTMPVVLGFTASVAACIVEKDQARRPWLAVSALTGAGLIMCFWQIRIFGFVGPIALLGGAWLIARLYERVAQTRGRALSAGAWLLVLPFSPVGWALAATAFSETPQQQPRNACLATSAYAPLAQLPPGLIAAPIDMGSHILALTPHSVLAAPYHRDNHGNRVALDAFLAPPDAAQNILRADKVTYVVNCPGMGELNALAKRAPDSLAAHIIAGTSPAWLTPVPQRGLFQVFVMKP